MSSTRRFTWPATPDSTASVKMYRCNADGAVTTHLHRPCPPNRGKASQTKFQGESQRNAFRSKTASVRGCCQGDHSQCARPTRENRSPLRTQPVMPASLISRWGSSQLLRGAGLEHAGCLLPLFLAAESRSSGFKPKLIPIKSRPCTLGGSAITYCKATPSVI